MRNDLSSMATIHLTIQGQTFQVWLAEDPPDQERGLMQVTAEELAPLPDPAGKDSPPIERGMLFVFPSERLLSFWMRNTIIPLDIAYINDEGRIVKTYTMAPLETRLYPSVEPARYALEVRAGLFSELGVGVGDRVDIP